MIGLQVDFLYHNPNFGAWDGRGFCLGRLLIG
jgi:hypothetical protein